MTSKERILVVLRFARLHWWRFLLAVIVAAAVIGFLYNLSRIIPWFSSSLASSTVKQSLSVKGSKSSSTTKDSNNVNDDKNNPADAIPFVPPVPQIRCYVVEDRRIYTDIGFVPFGGQYRGLRLVRINRKAGQIYFASSDGSMYVVGLDGVPCLVQDYGNTEQPISGL